MTHVSLQQLTAALDALRATSEARRKQINWIVSELTAALEMGDLPREAATNPDILLAPETLALFLTRADQDAYRPRNRVSTQGPSLWTARARRTVLRAITSKHTGRPAALPYPTEKPPPEEVATEHQRRGLWSFVADAHLEVPEVNEHRRRVMIRLAAIVGIVLDTGARTGEVAQLDACSDLTKRLTRCVLTHAPQKGGAHAGERVEYLLSQKTTAALRRWMPLRDSLVEHHTGADVTALWVTVRGGGYSGSDRPVHTPGMPLSSRTFAQQYGETVNWLNVLRAKDPTWQSLPNTIERLRRSSSPVEASSGLPRPER